MVRLERSRVIRLHNSRRSLPGGFFFWFYAILKGNSHPGEAEFFLE